MAHLAPGRGLLVLDTRPDAEGAPGSAIDAVLARAFGCARVVAWDGAGDALDRGGPPRRGRGRRRGVGAGGAGGRQRRGA